ncbi:MAG: hypothetical protein AAF485_26285 [Chloroflexota bacterium]
MTETEAVPHPFDLDVERGAGPTRSKEVAVKGLDPMVTVDGGVGGGHRLAEEMAAERGVDAVISGADAPEAVIAKGFRCHDGDELVERRGQEAASASGSVEQTPRPTRLANPPTGPELDKNDHLGLMRGYLPTSQMLPQEIVRDEVDLIIRQPAALPGVMLLVNLYQVQGDQFPTFGEVTMPITVDPAGCNSP